MTFLEMQTLVRDYLNEDSAGNWTDAMVKRAINRAIKAVRNKIINLNQDYFVTSANLNFTEQTETTALPSGGVHRVVLAERVDGNSRRDLGLISVAKKNENARRLALLYGDPLFYFLYANVIGWSPIPSQTVTSAVKLWYIAPQADLVADGETLPAEWTEAHHELVCYEAIARLIGRDREAFDVFRPVWADLNKTLTDDMASRSAQEAPTIRPVAYEEEY